MTSAQMTKSTLATAIAGAALAISVMVLAVTLAGLVVFDAGARAQKPLSLL